VHTEQRLTEGFYAVCICLAVNGDGGCNDSNEFTRIFSKEVPYHTIKVISKPRLGRYEETHGQQTVRHISGMSHKYHIKTQGTLAGYQLSNGDKIYFAPAGMGCAQLTKYSGPGTHVYDHAANSYISTGVDRRWRTIAKTICTSVSANAQANCDTNNDGIFAEQCAVYAFCDTANPLNGGCGYTGTCNSPIPGSDAADRTAPINVAEYDTNTLAATITTPSGTPLSTTQNLTACFATQESLAGSPADVTDYVPLQDGLEVILPPRLGPISSPGDIRAIENSSPSFTVNSMKYGDLLYFVPKNQNTADIAAGADDCNPFVCTVVGASGVGSNCDATYDGLYDDTCVFRAKCNPSNLFNGGCGAHGRCEKQIPTVSTSRYTGLLNGSSFTNASMGQIVLPTSPLLAVAPFLLNGILPPAYYLAACFIPAGAIQTLISNVAPLQDALTIFNEPIDSLITVWQQNDVQELRFTDPFYGYWGNHSWSTGYPGDIVVLKKRTLVDGVISARDCTGVHEITAAHYSVGQNTSAWIILEEAGNVTVGDQKGGTAGILPLAAGKVNELEPGNYSVCYATKNSEGESQADFKMLDTEIEILTATDESPQLTIPRTVLLGQDIVVAWETNHGLRTRNSKANSWIGLYSHDDCLDSEYQHECYKAFQFVEANVDSGTVIFSQKDYKIAGDFDVRYFVGDTRNGQGRKCAGMTSVDHETYVQCRLVPAVTSSSIHIHGTDMRELEDMDAQPGLEVVFAGNRGRFN